MKIYDCFMFNDEDLVLDIRLNTLNKYVDYFVIVESKFTHSGKKKNLNFNYKNFSNFKDKIIYIIADQKFDEQHNYPLKKRVNLAWQVENFQRNQISAGLRGASDEDIVMVSDADEIPNLEKIDFSNLKEKVVCFSLKLFYYKLNLFLENNWHGTKLCKMKDLKSPQWLRSLKTKKKYSFFRIDKIFSKTYEKDFLVIENGGWHFAWMKTPLQIFRKLESYAHLENDIPEIKNLEHIENSIKERKSFLNNNLNLQIINAEENLPKYIIENHTKFKNWLI